MRWRAFVPWAFALAACALVGWVAALVSSHLERVPGTGFEERATSGLQCDGAPTTSVVREPFLLRREESTPRCITWTGSLVARAKMRAQIEAMFEGTATVTIDGRPVLTPPKGVKFQTTTGTADITPGVHPFVVAFRSDGGPEYLRISMDDDLDPHGYLVVAPLDESLFYPTAAAADAALKTIPSAPRQMPALLAALALALAGTCAWLAIRLFRRRAIPWADLAIAVALFAAALYVRAHALDVQDICWDEGILSPSAHYIRNVVLGDYFSEAWAYNIEHLPLSKWVLAIGDVLGGLNGARIFVGAASAAAVSFLFAFGTVAFDRRVGTIAGALGVVLPLWVAHGRIAGHESLVLFWWGGSMLALACWVRSLDEAPGSRGDPIAAFACVFAATAGVFSRPTAIWIIPVLIGAWLVFTRGSIAQRLRAFPLAAIAGGVSAIALVIALWPVVWSDPDDKLARMSAHWSKPLGDIEVYLGKLTMPAWHYFAVAFLAETPALLLSAAAVGIALALRPGVGRGWGVVCLLWLLCPFGQSVSTLRIGAGRYVIQAWPALVLFAAVAIDRLGDKVASLASRLPRWGRALVRASPAIALFVTTYVALLHVEPYPLDYFNEIVGGPAGIAARKTFEVPWWGEGNLAAMRILNRDATRGAKVNLSLWPSHALLRLRDDLVPVTNSALGDYVLLSHLQYFARPPVTPCTKITTIDVAGAPLVDMYHCTPASSVQVGYAAMTRGAPDEAIPLFREALDRKPNDPAALFGMGWADHAKGNLRDAELYYAQALIRATQQNDAETEYYARYDLGKLYIQQGRLDDARTMFERAQALRPNEASVAEALRSLHVQ